MRIFVLLGFLLLVDTIWVGQGSSIDKLLSQLKEAEEKRDRRIENKMDQAVGNLTVSVREMHEKLKAFIASDADVNSDMKAQFDSISKQVSKLETSVEDAFNLLKMRMAKPASMKTHKTHQPANHDEEPEEDDEEPEEFDEDSEESEESQKSAGQNAMEEPEARIRREENDAPPQPAKKVKATRGRGGSRGRPKGGLRKKTRKRTRTTAKEVIGIYDDNEPAPQSGDEEPTLHNVCR